MPRSKLIFSESDWLERIESLLGYLTIAMSWDGLLVVTGDVNKDMQKPSDNNLTRNYQTLLEAFSLKQIVTKPTRVTRTSKTLIDHIVVSFSTKHHLHWRHTLLYGWRPRLHCSHASMCAYQDFKLAFSFYGMRRNWMKMHWRRIFLYFLWT